MRTILAVVMAYIAVFSCFLRYLEQNMLRLSRQYWVPLMKKWRCLRGNCSKTTGIAEDVLYTAHGQKLRF